MKLAGLLLFAVVGWTGLGMAGIVLSLVRHRRAEAIRHAAWLVAVLGMYLVILLAVSILQRPKLVPLDQDQCFGTMCFAVVHVDEVPSLVYGDQDRFVRATIRVSNHGNSADADTLIHAYLIDSTGNRWEPLPGLSGNRLTAHVTGQAQMLSQPMFRVARDSTSLGLVLTHGNWQPGRVTIGDSDSLAHQPNVVPLQR